MKSTLVKELVVNGMHRIPRMVPEEGTGVPGVMPHMVETEEFLVEMADQEKSMSLSFFADSPQGFIPGSVFEVTIRPMLEVLV